MRTGITRNQYNLYNTYLCFNLYPIYKMQTKEQVKEEMKFFYNDVVLITSDTEDEFYEDILNFYGGEFWTIVSFDRVGWKLYYDVRIDEDTEVCVPSDCLVDANDVFDEGDCCCDDCCCCSCEEEDEEYEEEIYETIHRCPDCWAIICPHCWEAF